MIFFSAVTFKMCHFRHFFFNFSQVLMTEMQCHKPNYYKTTSVTGLKELFQNNVIKYLQTVNVVESHTVYYFHPAVYTKKQSSAV